MALLAVASGTQAAVVSTEHTLTTQTVVGVYALRIDVAAMASGDTLVIKIKTKTLSGGTSRIEQEVTLTGAQSKGAWLSEPIPADVEVVCTITQSAGTARSYPWKLLRA